MRIDPELLDPATLARVIEEFVTRDGTDLTDVAHKTEQVLRQLRSGTVVLTYDEELETCNIVAADEVDGE